MTFSRVASAPNFAVELIPQGVQLSLNPLNGFQNRGVR